MDTVIYVIMSFLALIGMATIIRCLAYLIFKSDFSTKIYNVILLDNNNPEMIIRDAYEQVKFNCRHSTKIYALDCGMDESVRKEAIMMLADYNIELCDKQTLGEKISEG